MMMCVSVILFMCVCIFRSQVEDLSRGFEIVKTFVSVVSEVVTVSGGEQERYA